MQTHITRTFNSTTVPPKQDGDIDAKPPLFGAKNQQVRSVSYLTRKEAINLASNAEAIFGVDNVNISESFNTTSKISSYFVSVRTSAIIETTNSSVAKDLISRAKGSQVDYRHKDIIASTPREPINFNFIISPQDIGLPELQ